MFFVDSSLSGAICSSNNDIGFLGILPRTSQEHRFSSMERRPPFARATFADERLVWRGWSG